jgi:hypothetical protein
VSRWVPLIMRSNILANSQRKTMPNLAAANTSKVVLPGLANPLGVHYVHAGLNFSAFSRGEL